MATIDSEITKLRYDLRDENQTQYSTAMLIDFYNRAVPALASFLASVKSDWTLGSDTLTISSGNNYTALPDNFSTPRKAKINNNDLLKKDPGEIIELQQETSSGTPDYYSVHKLNMIFDRAVSEDTSVFVLYNEKPDELEEGDNMPYNDEFNDVLRGAVCMFAKNRNERTMAGDAIFHEFFRSSAISKVVSRKKKSVIKLGF